MICLNKIYHHSLYVLQPKQRLYFFVVGVLLSDPLRVFCGDFEPGPVCEVGVEKDTRMESVTSFDHFAGLSVVKVHSVKNLINREVIVDNIVVFVAVTLVDYLLVNLGQIAGQSCGIFASSGIGAEPPRTGTDFKAIKEVVDFVVSDIKGMDGALQVFIEQVSVGEAKNDKVASLGQLGVEPVEQSDDVFLEIFRPSAAYAASANIVSDELHEEQHGVVSARVSVKRFYISPTVSRVSSVHSQVLEIIVIAHIPLPEVFVDGMGGVGSGGVSSIGRLLRNVEFISQFWEQVLEGAFLHHAHVEKLLGNGKVSACRVTHDPHSQSHRFTAQLLLQIHALRVHAKYAIAVVVPR